MKILHFEDYEDFAFTVADKYEKIKGKYELDSIDIIAKYCDAKEIICELVGIGYNIHDITINDVEYDGYEDEYVVSIYDDEIWCEPAKRGTDYLHPEAKVVYLLDDCSSKIIPLIEADKVYEVRIGDDECECKHCDYYTNDNNGNCKIYVDEDDNVIGFEISKDDENSHMEFSYHSISDDFLSEDEIETILKFFA